MLMAHLSKSDLSAPDFWQEWEVEGSGYGRHSLQAAAVAGLCEEWRQYLVSGWAKET